MRKIRRRGRWQVTLIVAFMIGLLLIAWLTPSQAGREPKPPVSLPGLTSEEQARFEEGRKLFEHPFRPREGLGPVFNARACQVCHRQPSIGGHGPGYQSNIRYAGQTDSGTGTLFHARMILGRPADELPGTALLSKRRPPSLQGLGLIEAIPDDAILAYADPDDRDGDGISGRAAMRNRQLLRFGSQAHVGSLFEFVSDALRQEMGLTSAVPGFEQELGEIELPRFVANRIPQPNMTREAVRTLVEFVAMLAPPTRKASFFGEQRVARGERVFQELACANCHVPTFRTRGKPFVRSGDSEPVSTRALLNQEIAPYSDFLLHDLGPTLDDGVAVGVATSSEYKTPPLWGVRSRQNLLMHDGRANNLEQAILYHGGEAARSRTGFLELLPEDRRGLIEFLKTL